MPQSFDALYAPKAMSLDELFAAIEPPPLLPVGYEPSGNSGFTPASFARAQSLDELYAPKAMSLDELFAAIRPPPLLPVGFEPSNNSASMPASFTSTAGIPQPIPPGRLWAGVQPTPLSLMNSPAAPQQNAPSQNRDLNGPSTLGVLGGEIGGLGLPIIPKSRMDLNSRTSVTSPLSRAMSGTALMEVPLDKYLPWRQLPTPTIGSWKAKAGNFGRLIGRDLPALAGIPLVGFDVYNSDNRWRTGVGDAFGVIGGGLGGMAGGPTLAGTLPGALLGSYAGNQIGLGLYDGIIGHGAQQRGGGATGAW